MATYTVTMIGDSGELEVHTNPGADREEIDSWDSAIRAAWVRLGQFGDGWDSARVVGPFGRTVDLRRADKDAYDAARFERARRDMEERDSRPGTLEPLFED
jgi:hypothetical protein